MVILANKSGLVETFSRAYGAARMIEACERRILEFPLGMDARQVAKELKRERWYAWASDYESIIFRIERVRAKAGNG